MEPNHPLRIVLQQQDFSEICGPQLLSALVNRWVAGNFSVQVRGVVSEYSDSHSIDTFLVQGFYAYRISILEQSKIVTGEITALSLIQLGGGITVGSHSEQKMYSTQTPDMLLLEYAAEVWIVGSVLCDIIIAVCMTYYLSRYDHTIKQTQAKIMIKKVIRLTIETGSLIAIVGVVCLVLVSLSDSPYYYQFPVDIIGKVYTNSMLVLMNSRMLIGCEDIPLTIVSEMRFGMAPANNKNSAKEADGGDFGVGNVEKFRASS